ncbi:MAG: hypothetical protein ACOX19_09840 [Fermentimonas sp.]
MRKVALAFMAFLLFVSGCDKEPKRMDDYFVEFATLLKEGSSIRFQLDNGQLLTPESNDNIKGEDRQRVILNYTPLGDNRVKINYMSPIYTGVIEEGYPERYANDPVKVQSVWVSGGYLNLIIEVEYHGKGPSLALLRERRATDINLYLSHSRNDALPGYPKVIYASFLLNALRSEHPKGSEQPVSFHLFINTYTGMRVFQLELK